MNDEQENSIKAKNMNSEFLFFYGTFCMKTSNLFQLAAKIIKRQEETIFFSFNFLSFILIVV